MSEAKHSPGPWSFDRDWCRLPTIYAANGSTKIATIEKTSRNEHTEAQAANARLIAAAPDLLAALKAAEQRLNESGTGEMGLLDTIHAVYALIKPAIAKAEATLIAEERGTNG